MTMAAVIGWFIWGLVVGLVLGLWGARAGITLLLAIGKRQMKDLGALTETVQEQIEELERKRAIWRRFEEAKFAHLGTGKPQKDEKLLTSPLWEGPDG